MSLKDGNLIVKEYHTCVKEKQSVVLDATQRMSDQVRTIAVAEPTKPAVQIANEVMEAVIEEYEGMFKYIIWTFWTKKIFLGDSPPKHPLPITQYYSKTLDIMVTNN